MPAQETEAALTRLIDIGVDEVFGDYDEYKSVRPRAIALLNDGKRKTIDLVLKGRLPDLVAACTEAEDKIQAAGAKSGVSIIYMFDDPAELVFVQATIGSDRALCALVLERQAGVSTNDIHLVTEIIDSECSFWEPSIWGGPRCKIALARIPEIPTIPTARRKLNG